MVVASSPGPVFFVDDDDDGAQENANRKAVAVVGGVCRVWPL